MTEIDQNSWHGRLFTWSYCAFDQKPPRQFDLWLYFATVLGAVTFLVCAFVICIVLNIGTLPFGVFVEPIWKPDARFRRLAFPGGIQVIAVAAPLWVALAVWRQWSAHGIALTLVPFIFTPALGFLLLGCVVLFNGVRRKSPRMHLAD